MVCVLLCAGAATAQRQTGATAIEKTRQTLISNARSLEARGRQDLAVQVWQQILISDARNAEALAGVARDYKLLGKTQEANAALDRLRAAYPNDPNIAKIQSMRSVQGQNDQLRQAGELARSGKSEDAIKAYRSMYGDHPPDGDIGLAYYQTLYGTANGKQEAISGLRGMMQRNPNDKRFAIALGKMLTYDAKTRSEGVRLLRANQSDPDAAQALRQALVWESSNPASAGDLRDYLRTHPNDAELAAKLKDNEARLAQMKAGIARNPEESAAYAALNAKRLDEAQRRFAAILEKDPKNGRAAAGMGFLRMQQNNFAGAISFLTQAEQNGYRDKSVEQALETSRFWFTMGEASQALDEGQFDTASAKYREALAMKPNSPEALMGLAGLLVREEQYTQAADVYGQLLKQQPESADAWRGLFLSYARGGDSQQAMALAEKFPDDVRAVLNRDPDYLLTLATLYKTEGRSTDAENVLAQALTLPLPEGGANLKSATRLQYASILMAANRFSQAAAMYTQILNEDGTNMSAWMGLISAEHQMGQDDVAITTVEKMPPATYETALNNLDFLSMLGSIYQQNNRNDVALQLLERAAKLQSAGGAQPGIPLQMQLAAIYLQSGNTEQAYGIYRQVLTAHPENQQAWKGLVSTLQATNHTTEALQQIAYIPQAVRQKLEQDPEFVQAEASLYAAGGDYVHATESMNRVNSYYARLRQPMPASMAVQNAWLLFNTKNDRALYPALMNLGGRADLTVAQREQVQNIWASWAAQRAGAAFDNGNNERAVQILEAASAAFPDNVTVKRTLAGGYLKVGHSRQALAIFKSLPTEDATAADYQGAIGAALAANDKTQAEAWLREALARYPGDYRVLGAAARFEQARGDDQRAADYWRAAIASLPPGSPTDRLAHELAYPEEDTKPHKATTAADLARLLNPDQEPFQRTVPLPPLPSYGADPYLGRAPVVPSQQAAVQPSPYGSISNGSVPNSSIPTTTQIPVQTGTPASTAPLPAPSKHVKKAKTKAAGGAQGTTNLPPINLKDQNVGPGAPVQQAAPRTKPQTRMLVPYLPGSGSGDAVGSSGTVGASAGSEAGAVYVPGPAAAPQQVGANRPPQFTPGIAVPQGQTQGQAPTPGHYDIQTGLKLTDEPEDSVSARVGPALPVPDRSIVQPTAMVQVEAPIRPLENAQISLPSNPIAAPPTAAAAVATQPGSLEPVQYTPSAQDAATGAYSAQTKQKPSPSPQQQTVLLPVTAETQSQEGAAPKTTKRRAKKSTQPQQATQTVPTLATAPGQAEQPAIPVEQAQQEQAPAQTDQDLQKQGLPPLRGPWVRVQRQPRQLSPREEAELQLRSLESSYSPWLGGTGIVNARSGNAGYDKLTALEAPFEASVPWRYNGRFTIIAKPVFLNSGQADGTAVISVLESTQSGTALVTIPEPLGTDTNTGPNTTTGSTGTPPAQQNASGLGGEAQLAFPHLQLAVGHTPYDFLVSNWTGRANWNPGGGPLTVSLNRDSVKDTQLSYAGLRDPGSASLGYPGNIWGGVMSNEFGAQFAKGDLLSGYYVSVGGRYLNGYHVQSNSRYDGDGGAYWRVWTLPEYGSLTVGANFFGMHYAHNESAYTYGMGGYFSPQAFFLANIPITWTGHYETRWHYEVSGGFGVQAFQQDKTPLFPLAGQKPSLIALNNAALPALTTVGANYNFRAVVAHQLGEHWFIGGFLSANNTSNYNAVSAGFSVHYLFRPQPSTVASPTGLFPSDGFRPFRVP
jgi:tetratricopeptide (TPR) repeat protein